MSRPKGIRQAALVRALLPLTTSRFACLLPGLAAGYIVNLGLKAAFMQRPLH